MSSLEQSSIDNLKDENEEREEKKGSKDNEYCLEGSQSDWLKPVDLRLLVIESRPIRQTTPPESIGLRRSGTGEGRDI